MNSVITLCIGHRCAALLGRSALHLVPLLRSAVRDSSRAVLVSTGCVGACAQAPVLALSDGVAEQGRFELCRTSWLGPVGEDQVLAICSWVGEEQRPSLPSTLSDAVFAQT